MTRRGAIIIAVTIVLALLALLVYSLDRTSWLLAQYELAQPGTLAEWIGLSPLALGVAAALVIEVGAVALVAGDVLALERSAIKRYATAGLAVVLSVQALANLLAGFLRGYASVQATLVASGVQQPTAQAVAGLSWVLSSAAVPALIFILSKLAAHVVRLALSAPQPRLAEPHAEPVGLLVETTTLPAVDPLIEKKALAARMRSARRSWQDIADAVGRSPSTVRGWLVEPQATAEEG